LGNNVETDSNLPAGNRPENPFRRVAANLD
jgi:hypothetical protein